MKYLTTKYMGFGDGVGSQIQRRISIWAYCKLNDIQYVHTPFFELEHNYKKDDKFKNNWETFFNLGCDELKLKDVNARELNYVEQMHDYFDKENSPNLYDKVRDEFRKKYFMTEKPKLMYDHNFINVAVHVRRGDIVGRKHIFKKRGTSDEYFISLMEKLNQETTKKPYKFYVFSVNKTTKRGFRMKKTGDIFEKYRNLDLNIELMIDGCPFFDFHHLISADVLITSKSSFPYVAGLFSTNRVIYNKFWHKPKSYWEVGT
jgi:hypothetical protein